MINRNSFIAVFILVAISLLATLQPTTSTAINLKSGAVYVLTNQVSNSVAVFDRAPDGTSTPAGTFSTGGAGNPVAQPGDPPADPLASQGALIRSDNFLFAVNAGSNEISVLSIGKDALTLVDKVSSGGVRPISLTVHENLLYVLNEGGTPNITGFTISDTGELTPLAGSTQPLTAGSVADPAEVSFNNDGTLLAVTEKAANLIDVYLVGSDGVAGPPNSNPSNGMTPFGFAFDQRNHLVVSEAFGGAPNAAAVSSYNAALSGTLEVVSGSVPDMQTAACWIVITNSGRYVYTTNTGTGVVSSYQLAGDGTLTLLNSVAASLGATSGPVDMALNNSSRFLYVLANGLQTVEVFRVNPDGSLTHVESVGGLPFGTQGIAAR
jgi:6-phosphogluconolactonase (cycloisomerase 2 family)